MDIKEALAMKKSLPEDLLDSWRQVGYESTVIIKGWDLFPSLLVLNYVNSNTQR